MRKTHKQTIGLLGLALVLVTTIFAANLPSPTVNATDINLNITVRNNNPNINIIHPQENAVLDSPHQTVTYEYNKLTNLTVEIVHTNPDGVTTTFTPNFNQPAHPGQGSGSFDLDLSQYGPGSFLIKLKADTTEGTTIEKTASFRYSPIAPEVPNTGALFSKFTSSRPEYLITLTVAIASFLLFLFARPSKRKK